MSTTSEYAMFWICPFSHIVLLFSSTAVTSTLTTNGPTSTHANIALSNLDALNDSVLLSLNSTATSNVSDALATLPTPLIHLFPVPNTQTYLRLGFGVPWHPLDRFDMGGLIATVQYFIDQGIENYGLEGYPGIVQLTGIQEFGYTLGDGCHFYIRNVKGSGRYFTWEQARNVLEGLRLYLIVGERFYATSFGFWDGPGTLGNSPLGGGGLRVGGEPLDELVEE